MAGAAGNYEYYRATKTIQSEVSTGSSLTVAMQNAEVFPNMVLQMVAIGEEAGSLDGITREVMFEIAEELGLRLVEQDMTRYEIYTADECFLTGTAAEIIPAVKLDTREIGSGTPGPLTRKLIARFRELTATSGDPIYK